MKLSMNKVLGIVTVVGSLGLSFAAISETVEERIKPVGEVCKAGDSCAAAVAAAATGGAARSGEEIYSTKCFTCHATGAANAPKLGDAAAWQPRLTERTLDGLYTNAIKGYNGMPAKGLCMDCSDDEIKAAVDHILAGSK